MQAELFEWHIESDSCISKPACILDPRVWSLFLFVIFKYLFEQSKMIVQPDSISLQTKCRNGIQEAGCQSSKSSVTQ